MNTPLIRQRALVWEEVFLESFDGQVRRQWMALLDFPEWPQRVHERVRAEFFSKVGSRDVTQNHLPPGLYTPKQSLESDVIIVPRFQPPENAAACRPQI